MVKHDQSFTSSYARFSECERYRYRLGRGWDFGTGIVLWVMLNPSTADAEKNDPTIGRCIQFSKAWGYAGLMIGNAYALRSTDPKGLWEVDDPVGGMNDCHLHLMAGQADRIIVAWGTHAKQARTERVRRILAEHRDVECMGLTKHGAPKHPLYLHSDTTPIMYYARS